MQPWNQWGVQTPSAYGMPTYPGQQMSATPAVPQSAVATTSAAMSYSAAAALQPPTATGYQWPNYTAPAAPTATPGTTLNWQQQQQQQVQQQQQWEQWQQWQQQYTQWQQQYGKDYMNTLQQQQQPSGTAVASTVNTAMNPMMSLLAPPPPASAAPSFTGGAASSVRPPGPPLPNSTALSSVGAGTPAPQDSSSAQAQSGEKRGAPGGDGGSDSKKLKSDDDAIKACEDALKEMAEAEKQFDQQFNNWESQFNAWREENANHPDIEQYKAYEAKWTNWRTHLLQRREQMKKKKETKTAELEKLQSQKAAAEAEAAAAAAATPVVSTQSSTAMASGFPAAFSNMGVYGSMFPPVPPPIVPPSSLLHDANTVPTSVAPMRSNPTSGIPSLMSMAPPPPFSTSTTSAHSSNSVNTAAVNQSSSSQQNMNAGDGGSVLPVGSKPPSDGSIPGLDLLNSSGKDISNAMSYPPPNIPDVQSMEPLRTPSDSKPFAFPSLSKPPQMNVPPPGYGNSYQGSSGPNSNQPFMNYSQNNDQSRGSGNDQGSPFNRNDSNNRMDFRNPPPDMQRPPPSFQSQGDNDNRNYGGYSSNQRNNNYGGGRGGNQGTWASGHGNGGQDKPPPLLPTPSMLQNFNSPSSGYSGEFGSRQMPTRGNDSKFDDTDNRKPAGGYNSNYDSEDSRSMHSNGPQGPFNKGDDGPTPFNKDRFGGPGLDRMRDSPDFRFRNQQDRFSGGGPPDRNFPNDNFGASRGPPGRFRPEGPDGEFNKPFSEGFPPRESDNLPEKEAEPPVKPVPLPPIFKPVVIVDYHYKPADLGVPELFEPSSMVDYAHGSNDMKYRMQAETDSSPRPFESRKEPPPHFDYRGRGSNDWPRHRGDRGGGRDMPPRDSGRGGPWVPPSQDLDMGGDFHGPPRGGDRRGDHQDRERDRDRGDRIGRGGGRDDDMPPPFRDDRGDRVRDEFRRGSGGDMDDRSRRERSRDSRGSSPRRDERWRDRRSEERMREDRREERKEREKEIEKDRELQREIENEIELQREGERFGGRSASPVHGPKPSEDLEKVNSPDALSEDIFEVAPSKTPAPSVPSHQRAFPVADLLLPPGRASRPPRIVVIIRGPPGSGKSYAAKLIKDKEIEMEGSAPRILSLDDYFMSEVDKEEVDPKTGRKIVKKVMEYEYEAACETRYRDSLLKSFRKTIIDGYFPFIIVDSINDKLSHFEDMSGFARQKSFQVYVCEMDLDLSSCVKRNIHKRSEKEIEDIIQNWEKLPPSETILDIRSLLQEAAITEVDMEDTSSPEVVEVTKEQEKVETKEVEEKEDSEPAKEEEQTKDEEPDKEDKDEAEEAETSGSNLETGSTDLRRLVGPPPLSRIGFSFQRTTSRLPGPPRFWAPRRGFGGRIWRSGYNRRR